MSVAPVTTSFRRHLLDQALAAYPFSGRVLDIGGKKHQPRGAFRPPLAAVASWQYLNLDPASQPDFCCSAERMPLESGAVDIALMTEVLEHLAEPEAVLAETRRVLIDGGRLIATMPFLYPLHADPDDFQRWTPAKLQHTLTTCGFAEIEIRPMGGLFAVTHDLLYVATGLASADPGAWRNRIIRKLLTRLAGRLLLALDRRYAGLSRHITTGYWIEAKAC